MKWVILVTYLVVTSILVIKGFITINASYIGIVIMLAAEYIEDCIERKK